MTRLSEETINRLGLKIDPKFLHADMFARNLIGYSIDGLEESWLTNKDFISNRDLVKANMWLFLRFDFINGKKRYYTCVVTAEFLDNVTRDQFLLFLNTHALL